jgi:hypothetical protein
MTNSAQMFQVLRQHRPLLLACEAIGWLHMTGKAHPDFLRHHGGVGVDYDDLCWHERESPPFPWSDKLAWLKNGLWAIPSSGLHRLLTFWRSTGSETVAFWACSRQPTAWLRASRRTYLRLRRSISSKMSRTCGFRRPSATPCATSSATRHVFFSRAAGKVCSSTSIPCWMTSPSWVLRLHRIRSPGGSGGKARSDPVAGCGRRFCPPWPKRVCRTTT